MLKVEIRNDNSAYYKASVVFNLWSSTVALNLVILCFFLGVHFAG